MKKFFLLPIVFLLMVNQIAFIFAAGGQGSGNTSAGAGNRAAVLAEIGFNATGYPIVSKPYSFSGLVTRQPLHGNPYKDMLALQNMEKQSGVTVEWIEVPAQSFQEQKNLRLASNDLPDVFFHGINDADQLRYGPAGVLVPNEKLVDEYAPRINTIYSKRPDIKKGLTGQDSKDTLQFFRLLLIVTINESPELS